MKKKLFVLLTCVLTAFVMLAGCNKESSGSGEEASASGSSAADEKVYELTLHHHDPVTASQGIFFEAMAKEVEENSGGRLKITNFHGGQLGGPRDTVDMVLNGTCDIGGGLPAFFPGLFPMSEALTLPMIGVETSDQATKALWDLYENYDYMKEEYSEFKVLMLVAMNDSSIGTTDKEIKTVDDLKGMKIRVNAGPPTDFTIAAGATPMNIVIGELYSSLEKGVLDGVITDWNAFNAFKLYDQLNYVLDEHITVNPYFVLMNKNSFNSLPPDLQKVLEDATMTPEARAAFAAEYDKITLKMKDLFAEQDKMVYTLPPAEHDKLVALAGVAHDKWVEDKTDAGYPAQEVADKVVELLEKYK